MIIDADKCTCCMKCVKQCPEGAIIGWELKQPPVIDVSRCNGCNVCRTVCDFQAIDVSIYITEAGPRYSDKLL